jgi:tRNA A-37 threonylcarbamoyl transferase component Bud32/beta-lactam-binding protein with PASTA domain
MSQMLNGRYELGEVVGAGGMGAVYRATDTRLGRTVAVKALRGGALADELARARMRSEARLASTVHHPGVAQIYDYDDCSTTHGGMAFIVMEFIEGRSLADLLREDGRLPVDQVMSVVQQVAEALAAAHAAGVVHRDLKPANIMLTTTGRAVLVDFGIASSAASEPLTETGALIGTADYLSPEQAAGRSATSRSDLYSLGMVAFQCLTGTSPFRRDHHVATALAHLQDELPALDPSLPHEVRDLVRQMAEKNPADRPADAADVARRAAGTGAAASVDVPPTTSWSGPAPARRSRPRRTLVLYSGAGALVAALLVVGLGRWGAETPSPVPDVVGMDAAQATTAIEDEGMTPRRDLVDAPGSPAGRVVEQTPAAGEPGTDDGTVELVVASGKVGVSAEQIVGAPYSEAAATLEKLGLVVARTDVPSSGDPGVVLAVDRSGRLPEGSTVTLGVAVPMPTPVASVPASTGVQRSAPTTTRKATAPARGSGTAKGKGRGKGHGKKK